MDINDYGIGLFVPGVKMLIGGRFSHNGTKDPAAGPTNYVAPIYSLKLLPYKPLEYSYIITSGNLPEIRQKFKDRKDFTDNCSFINYNK